MRAPGLFELAFSQPHLRIRKQRLESVVRLGQGQGSLGRAQIPHFSIVLFYSFNGVEQDQHTNKYIRI